MKNIAPSVPSGEQTRYYVYTTRVNTGAKKRKYEKLCRFVKCFVVQVNNCDCKLCVFTHNVSVSFINYITYLFSGYFKGYVSTKNEMKS